MKLLAMVGVNDLKAQRSLENMKVFLQSSLQELNDLILRLDESVLETKITHEASIMHL